MDLPFPWTFVLFTLCFVALIAGALLGFAVGFRTGGRQERFRLVKEKLKRNKAAICRWQKGTLRICQAGEAVGRRLVAFGIRIRTL